MKTATRYILDPDLVDWVRAESARRRCSMSQVIRDLVVAEMERRGVPAVPPSGDNRGK